MFFNFFGNFIHIYDCHAKSWILCDEHCSFVILRVNHGYSCVKSLSRLAACPIHVLVMQQTRSQHVRCRFYCCPPMLFQVIRPSLLRHVYGLNCIHGLPNRPNIYGIKVLTIHQYESHRQRTTMIDFYFQCNTNSWVHRADIGEEPPWLIQALNDSWSMILWNIFVSMIDHRYSICCYECDVFLLSIFWILTPLILQVTKKKSRWLVWK